MADDAVAALEAELTEFARRWRSRTRAAAREVHPRLDPATFPLLVVLTRHGAQRVSALGERLQLDLSTVSRQVDAAERLGLVRRIADPDDARARLVELTGEGAERIGRAHEERLGRWRAALATWDDEDLRTLTRLLRRLGGGQLT